MITILLAILSIVAAVTPVILDLVGKYMASKEVSKDALIKRDLEVLHGPPTIGGSGGVQSPTTNEKL
jgi:hypothetical protein